MRRESSCRRVELALAVALVWGGCTCTRIAGPAAQLVEAARGFSNLKALPASALVIQRLEITRVTAEPELSPPRVVFSFDLEGSANGVAVSALGVEKVPMAYRDSRWQPVGSPLPRLEQTLAVLRPRSAGVVRWLIRVDVGKVEVTEELTGGARKVVRLTESPDGGVQPAN